MGGLIGASTLPSRRGKAGRVAVLMFAAAAWCSAASAELPARPNFSEQIAPVVFQHCVPCHRPEGSGPFPLATYTDVRRHAAQIALVTSRRIMPPWKVEGERGVFVDDRRLSEDQIALFQRWVDQGAVEGDPRRLPPAPTWSGGWQLGPPDLVLESPAYRLRAGGDDMWRNFVIPIPIKARRFIKAWQFLPGNHVVHHATFQFDTTGRSRQLDAKDPQPGYEGLIGLSVQGPDGFFLNWGSGHAPYVAPEGMAWPLEKNTDLVMMLHLRPSGKEEIVRAKLGLYFSDAPSRVPSLVRLTRQHMDIPAGESHYTVVDSYRLDVDVDVHTIAPHAHYLATRIDSFAILPDGSRKPLISIPDWNIHWQDVYRYVQPVSLPAGTTVVMEYVYDNSASNPFNPSTPPKRVRYGQRSSDEMAELFLQVTTKSSADRAKLSAGVRAKVLREEIIGHVKMLEADPNNAALHDDVALLYVEGGDLDRARAHFVETLRINPRSPAAYYNVGSVLLMEGKRQAAADYFDKAIALKPNYGLALERLGAIAHAAGRLELAVAHYERAADAFAAVGDFDRALAVMKSGLELAAENTDTQRRLQRRAVAYSEQRQYE